MSQATRARVAKEHKDESTAFPDNDSLKEQVQEQEARITEQEASIKEQASLIKEQTAKLDELTSLLKAMLLKETKTIPAEAVTVDSATSEVDDTAIRTEQHERTHVKEFKMPDVEYFKGDCYQYDNWCTELSLKFSNEPQRFATESAKINYAASFLRGPALKWYKPHLDKNSHSTFKTWMSFYEAMSAVFADPNELGTAKRELSRLRQTTTASSYAADFSRLTHVLGYNDRARIDLFLTGLKREVRDAIKNMQLPEDYNKLVKEIIRVDNGLSAFKASESGTNILQRQSFGRGTMDRNSSTNTSVDNSKRTYEPKRGNEERKTQYRLSDEEHQRRLQNHLCLNCGEAGHIGHDCPKRKPQNNSRGNISATVETKNQEAPQ